MLYFILGINIGIILAIIAAVSGFILGKKDVVNKLLEYKKVEGGLIEMKSEKQDQLDKLINSEEDIKLDDYNQGL